MVLPAVTVVLALVAAGAAAGRTQLVIEEAARAAARELARGEPPAAAAATASRIAGSGARVQVGTEAGWSVAEVASKVQAPLLGLLEIELEATASSRSETGPYGAALDRSGQ